MATAPPLFEKNGDFHWRIFIPIADLIPLSPNTGIYIQTTVTVGERATVLTPTLRVMKNFICPLSRGNWRNYKYESFAF